MRPELKYRFIRFRISQNHRVINVQNIVECVRDDEMNAGPTCPIRFKTPGDPKDSLADQCLTAAEIEWRRWSRWQMERTAEKQFKRAWS